MNTSSDSLFIDADFPGGNIIVNRVDGNTIHIEQELRDTATWWFYWQFRVRGAEGRTLTFRFCQEHMTGERLKEISPIGSQGPAVSKDQGATWQWLKTQDPDSSEFSYAFSPDDDDVRFCFAIPYLQSHLEVFLERHSDNPLLHIDTLAVSRKGRPIEKLLLGKTDATPTHRCLITARHHCCEMIAGYVQEGLMEAILADDGLQWLREQAEFLVIPFMDKDGVEDGDQGKNRIPYDHNRDYEGESIYPSVRALRSLVPQWSGGLLHAALDLHCPWIRGSHNEDIYLVGEEAPSIWEQQQKFCSILESIHKGALPYTAEHTLPFGESWNKKDNYSAGKSFGRWASEIPEILLSGSLEIPYASAGGVEISPGSAREFGKSLAQALQQYLQSST